MIKAVAEINPFRVRFHFLNGGPSSPDFGSRPLNESLLFGLRSPHTIKPRDPRMFAILGWRFVQVPQIGLWRVHTHLLALRKRRDFTFGGDDEIEQFGK